MTPTVCDLFERQVRERPDATAVRTSGRSWTYAEFGRTTARLAARLRRGGAGPGGIVGLVAPRGPQALTGIVAILRSGAACLPLDPDDPPLRNREILDGTRCRQVLVAAPAGWLPGAQLIDDPTLEDEEEARRSRRTRSTWPTPSPPPARPGARRSWACRTRASPTW